MLDIPSACEDNGEAIPDDVESASESWWRKIIEMVWRVGALRRVRGESANKLDEKYERD